MNKQWNWKTVLQHEQAIVWTQIVLGCIIGGAAYPLFLTPCNIAPGGLTGVGMILNYLFQFPIGTTALVLNIPLFIMGYRSMGHVFVIRSLVATVLFSLAIDILQLQPLTSDPMLGAIFGGALMGVGLGLILRGGATTGGTDMLAKWCIKAAFYFDRYVSDDNRLRCGDFCRRLHRHDRSAVCAGMYFHQRQSD